MCLYLMDVHVQWMFPGQSERINLMDVPKRPKIQSLIVPLKTHTMFVCILVIPPMIRVLVV